MLPEPRSLADGALPVPHWETGVIVIVIHMLLIMMMHSFFDNKTFPHPRYPLHIMNTKPKGSMMEMKLFSEGNHQTTSTHWPYTETQATIRLVKKVFLKFPCDLSHPLYFPQPWLQHPHGGQMAPGLLQVRLPAHPQVCKPIDQRMSTWTATTLRGFNSFSGYYTGAEHYFSHVRDKGYDFRKNENVDFGARGNYSTDLFNQEAVFWSFDKTNSTQNKTRSELWRGRQAQRHFFFTWPIRCLLKLKTVDTKSRPDPTLVKFIHFPK